MDLFYIKNVITFSDQYQICRQNVFSFDFYPKAAFIAKTMLQIILDSTSKSSQMSGFL